MNGEFPIDTDSVNEHLQKSFFGITVFMFYCTYVILHILLGHIPGAIPSKATREFVCQWKRNIICMAHSGISFWLAFNYLNKYPDLFRNPINHFESATLLLLSLNIGNNAYDIVGCIVFFGSKFSKGNLLRAITMLVFLLHVNSTKRYLGFTVVGFISDISSCVTCLRNTFIIRRTTKTWTYFVITIVNLALLLFVRPMILFCQLIFLQRQKVQQEQDWMLMLASMVAVINAVQTVYLIILTVGECTSGTPLQKLSAKSHELMLPIHSVHSSRS